MKLPITLWILAIVLSAWSPLIIAEHWIDTRDQWLRSDIERLAQAQIIRAPINTWPLMWPSLLEDLSDTPLAQIPKRLTDSHARVLAAGSAPSAQSRLGARCRCQFSANFSPLRRVKWRQKPTGAAQPPNVCAFCK